MFGTGKNIAKASIDFDELARLYLSQRYDESDTPDKFLVRFIKIREYMLKRFDEEPTIPPSIPSPAATATLLRKSPWT